MRNDLEQTVELFSGDAPFSILADDLGFKTFMVDHVAWLKPSLVADVLTLNPNRLPWAPHIIWAAPPSYALQNDRGGLQGSPRSRPEELAAVRAAVSAFRRTKAMWWFLEIRTFHPNGMARVFGPNAISAGLFRHEIDHAQYGEDANYSEVWTNARWWSPRGASTTRRPAKQYTRQRLPAGVYQEVFEHLGEYRRAA